MALVPEPHTPDCRWHTGSGECTCGVTRKTGSPYLHPKPVVEILETMGLDPAKVSGDGISLEFLGPRIVALRGGFVIILTEEQRRAVAEVFNSEGWEPSVG